MTASEFINRIKSPKNNLVATDLMIPWYGRLVNPSAKTLKNANKAAVLVHVFQGSEEL